MNIVEALVEAVNKALVTTMVAYKSQAHTMLLSGKVSEAQILAHKADALREASVLVLSAAQRFKDAEEE